MDYVSPGEVSFPTPISPIGVFGPNPGSASSSSVDTEFFAYEYAGVSFLSNVGRLRVLSFCFPLSGVPPDF